MVPSIISNFSLGVLFSIASLGKAAPQYNVLNDANFPDPSIINVGGTSYVFGTPDGAGHNTPLTTNSDFNDASGWSPITDVFPPHNVPAFGDNGWAVVGTSWAPDVNQLTDYDGSFAMYYSPALQSNDAVHCIGLARSANMEGPYNDSSTAPLICPEADGGAIDASGYLDDDNKRYIVYKIDGPAANKTSTPLLLQHVENDGYTLVGSPTVLYDNQGESDDNNVEAPVIVKGSDGTYFLFFSSNLTFDNRWF